MLATDTLADLDHPILTEGWGADDAGFLDELAQLGMGLARELTGQFTTRSGAARRGEARPLSIAESSRVARRFTRIARGVRLTLMLKARVRAGDPAVGRPGAVREGLLSYINSEPPPSEDAPDPAADALTALRLIRAETSADTERLIETLERPDREQARDRERFAHLPLKAMIGQICRDLGVEGDWRPLRSETGEIHAWIVTPPGEAATPLVWPYKLRPVGYTEPRETSGAPPQARAPP